MPVTIRPLTRPLPLDEYAEGLEIRFDDGPAKVVHVWVNPPRALREEHDRLLAEARQSGMSPELFAWYARLWSQHPDAATHWTAEEVQALAENDTDPNLLIWLQNRSIDMMTAHRSAKRKN